MPAVYFGTFTPALIVCIDTTGVETTFVTTYVLRPSGFTKPVQCCAFSKIKHSFCPFRGAGRRWWRRGKEYTLAVQTGHLPANSTSERHVRRLHRRKVLEALFLVPPDFSEKENLRFSVLGRGARIGVSGFILIYFGCAVVARIINETVLCLVGRSEQTKQTFPAIDNKRTPKLFQFAVLACWGQHLALRMYNSTGFYLV